MAKKENKKYRAKKEMKRRKRKLISEKDDGNRTEAIFL